MRNYAELHQRRPPRGESTPPDGVSVAQIQPLLDEVMQDVLA